MLASFLSSLSLSHSIVSLMRICTFCANQDWRPIVVCFFLIEKFSRGSHPLNIDSREKLTKVLQIYRIFSALFLQERSEILNPQQNQILTKAHSKQYLCFWHSSLGLHAALDLKTENLSDGALVKNYRMLLSLTGKLALLISPPMTTQWGGEDGEPHIYSPWKPRLYNPWHYRNQNIKIYV